LAWKIGAIIQPKKVVAKTSVKIVMFYPAVLETKKPRGIRSAGQEG
jgi:hypothetical protein